MQYESEPNLFVSFDGLLEQVKGHIDEGHVEAEQENQIHPPAALRPFGVQLTPPITTSHPLRELKRCAPM